MTHPRLPRVSAFEPRRHDTSDWTPERIAKLERQEIEQLRANANAVASAIVPDSSPGRTRFVSSM